jgi:2-phospho-L-lactate guanylyltransferase
MSDVWACVPVKEFTGAKQRLAALLNPEQREILAETMLEDVLAALAGASRLAGILVNTIDPRAAVLAKRYGARVVTEGATDGHTGAVNGMARILTAEGRSALLTVPGDIPRVTASEIDAVVSSCRDAPSFTIVPAHDELGSNAVLCAPPFAVPLRFGDDSYFPHLAAARRRGIEPAIVRRPGIGLDIDHPVDLLAFLRATPRQPTRTIGLLERFGL